MKSTAREGAKINGEDMYKIGTYSFRSMKYKTKRMMLIESNKTKALCTTAAEIQSIEK